LNFKDSVTLLQKAFQLVFIMLTFYDTKSLYIFL